MIRTLLVTSTAAMLAPIALPDTITLKNGVQVHGTIISQSEEAVRVSIAGNERTYSAASVAKIDENEKTGRFDPEAAIEAARARLAKLERETGLTAKQRLHVESLLFAMKEVNSKAYDDAKRELLDFHEHTAPLDKFLPYALQSIEPPVIGGLLDVYAAIDTFKGARAARSHVTCIVPSSRALALTVFARGEAPDRSEVIARGMVDHEYEVRIAAARALGQLKVRAATPLLIEAVGSGDPHLVVVARNALRAMWHSVSSPADFETQAEWDEFWAGRKASVPDPFVKTALLRLANPDEHYVAEE